VAGEEPTVEGELDIWLDPLAISAADEALANASFHHFHAPGQRHHRFYLACQEGRWFKIDAKLHEGGRPGPDRADLPRPLERVRVGLARRGFAGLHRLGPVVAVFGPDGAGKTSVIGGLRRIVPVAVTALYLGRRRARPPSVTRPKGPKEESRAPRSRAGRIRETAFVLRNAIRSWTKLMPGYLAAWRGHIVLCDRHPIEVLAVKPRRTQPARAVERFIAGHLTPRPDVMIVLDAPEEILLRRKSDHSRQQLEQWRRSYAEVMVPLGASIVSTTGPPESTITQVSSIVWDALRQRRSW
jgi:thymidylate kinase